MIFLFLGRTDELHVREEKFLCRNEQRQHGQADEQRPRHQRAVVGADVCFKILQGERHDHVLLRADDDAGPHVRIPVGIEGEHAQRDHAGDKHGQIQAEEDQELVRAVDLARFAVLVRKVDDELPHEKDRVHAYRAGEHDRRKRIVQPERVDDRELRHERHDAGEHHGGEHDAEDRVPAFETQLRKAVRRHRAEHKVGEQPDHRDDERVPDVLQEVQLFKRAHPVVARHVPEIGQQAEIGEHHGIVFKGRYDRPVKRQNHPDCHRDEVNVDDDLCKYAQDFRAPVLIDHPCHMLIRLLHELLRDERDRHDDKEEDHRHGGRVPAFARTERGDVDLVHGRRGRKLGPARREQVHLIEELERADQRHGDGEIRRCAEHGDRNVPEALHRTRAVDLRRFVQFARHLLERRHVYDHVPADCAPQVDEHDGKERRALVREPGAVGQPHAVQYTVEQAVRGVHQPLPDERRRDRARERGQVKEHAEQLCAEQFAVEHRRRDQRKHDDQRHVHQRVAQRIPQRRPVNAVRKQARIIVEPDHLHAVDEVVIGKAEHERHHERNDREHEEQQHGGRDERKADDVLLHYGDRLPLVEPLRILTHGLRFRRFPGCILPIRQGFHSLPLPSVAVVPVDDRVHFGRKRFDQPIRRILRVVRILHVFLDIRRKHVDLQRLIPGDLRARLIVVDIARRRFQHLIALHVVRIGHGFVCGDGARRLRPFEHDVFIADPPLHEFPCHLLALLPFFVAVLFGRARDDQTEAADHAAVFAALFGIGGLREEQIVQVRRVFFQIRREIRRLVDHAEHVPRKRDVVVKAAAADTRVVQRAEKLHRVARLLIVKVAVPVRTEHFDARGSEVFEEMFV